MTAGATPAPSHSEKGMMLATNRSDDGGPEASLDQVRGRLSPENALELHADPAKLPPHDQAILPSRAMQQHEAGREPVGIRQIETGAAGRHIDDRAADGRAVGSNNDRAGLRYQAGGPDTSIPATILRSQGRGHGGAKDEESPGPSHPLFKVALTGYVEVRRQKLPSLKKRRSGAWPIARVSRLFRACVTRIRAREHRACVIYSAIAYNQQRIYLTANR